MVDQYMLDIKELLSLSNEIEQFFDSEIEFDAKMDHIGLLLDQRETIIKKIELNKINKTNEHKKILRNIYDKDQVLIEKMNIFLEDINKQTVEVKKEKIQVSKKRLVNRKYLTPSSESSGYFINKKR